MNKVTRNALVWAFILSAIAISLGISQFDLGSFTRRRSRFAPHTAIKLPPLSMPQAFELATKAISTRKKAYLCFYAELGGQTEYYTFRFHNDTKAPNFKELDKTINEQELFVRVKMNGETMATEDLMLGQGYRPHYK